MGVLRQRSTKGESKIKINILLKLQMSLLAKRTRMMMRMADTPEVAITLAQLGMRLNRTGTIASAP